VGPAPRTLQFGGAGTRRPSPKRSRTRLFLIYTPLLGILQEVFSSIRFCKNPTVFPKRKSMSVRCEPLVFSIS
jgi:hypothetical protein